MAKEKRTEKKKPTRANFFAVATHSPKMCDRVRKQNKEQLLLLFESIEVNLDVAKIQDCPIRDSTNPRTGSRLLMLQDVTCTEN